MICYKNYVIWNVKLFVKMHYITKQILEWLEYLLLSIISAKFDDKHISEFSKIKKLKIDQYYEDYYLIKINQFFDFHTTFNADLKYKSMSLNTYCEELSESSKKWANLRNHFHEMKFKRVVQRKLDLLQKKILLNKWISSLKQKSLLFLFYESSCTSSIIMNI